MADDGDEVVVVGPDGFVPVTGLSLGMEAELGEIVGTCALALAANRTAATDVVINRLAERHLRTFPGVTLGGFMTLIFTFVALRSSWRRRRKSPGKTRSAPAPRAIYCNEATIRATRFVGRMPTITTAAASTVSVMRCADSGMMVGAS